MYEQAPLLGGLLIGLFVIGIIFLSLNIYLGTFVYAFSLAKAAAPAEVRSTHKQECDQLAVVP